ncbi:hypothetical protein [Mesorhizobium sp. L-2-11]|uniref:hypothetical protein n=1 Tax=Mesorhizobium sp. L-2-11 TaxID=2744521 RepID=UPI0018ECD1A2|nr:hypothetical protein [Mesorhizobium sp. L-2-11]BCH20204.1 hypothetical protein MesoLjLa_70550 [Mesorhizobium sp. L-2-11]
MSIFDDAAAARFVGFPDDIPSIEVTVRAALSSPIDQQNHLPIAHPALAKHYAEEAVSSWQRYVVGDLLFEKLVQAMGHFSCSDLCALTGGVLRTPASRMVVAMPAGKLVFFDEIAADKLSLRVAHYHRGTLALAKVDDDARIFRACCVVFQMLCAAMLIPRMTIVEAVRHEQALQRSRVKRKVAPLLSYNTVTVPLLRRGKRSAESFLEGLGPKKSLHHVQAFVRFIADDTSPIGRRGIFIRDHWRGSAAIGIRISERHPE